MKKTLLYFFSGLTLWARLAVVKPVETFTQLRTKAPPAFEVDNTVVRAFARGCEPAFKCIYDHYAPAIYRVVCRYLGSTVLAEDLLLKVFSDLWVKREKFAEWEEVKLFLFTSARVEAVRLLSASRRVVDSVTQPIWG